MLVATKCNTEINSGMPTLGTRSRQSDAIPLQLGDLSMDHGQNDQQLCTSTTTGMGMLQPYFKCTYQKLALTTAR